MQRISFFVSLLLLAHPCHCGEPQCYKDGDAVTLPCDGESRWFHNGHLVCPCITTTTVATTSTSTLSTPTPSTATSLPKVTTSSTSANSILRKKRQASHNDTGSSFVTTDDGSHVTTGTTLNPVCSSDTRCGPDSLVLSGVGPSASGLYVCGKHTHNISVVPKHGNLVPGYTVDDSDSQNLKVHLTWSPVPCHVLAYYVYETSTVDRSRKDFYGFAQLNTGDYGDLLHVTNASAALIQVLPFHRYQWLLLAVTQTANYTHNITVETPEGVPEPVHSLAFTHIASRSVALTWTPPSPSQLWGDFRTYIVKYSWANGAMESTISVYRHRPDALVDDLRPSTLVKFSVAVSNMRFTSAEESIETFTDVEDPDPPHNVKVESFSSNSFVVTWEKPNNTWGQEVWYIVQYINMDTSEDTKVNIQSTVLTVDHQPPAVYMIKVASVVPSIVDARKQYTRYSGPVFVHIVADPPGVSRKVIGLVVAVVLCVAILVAIVVVFVIFRRKAKYQYSEVSQNHAPVQNGTGTAYSDKYLDSLPSRDDISADDFPGHVAKCGADGGMGFSEEYEEINKACRSWPHECSGKKENEAKNRYFNIITFDHSRVILQSHDGSDYINASYVDGYHRPRAYIAAQGPLPNTVVDFWHMIWEQNSTVIIMLTNLTEKGRRKCDPYWPPEGEMTYGNIAVANVLEYVTAHFTVRKFHLKYLRDLKERISIRRKSNLERTVIHYHFTSWPDHGVPQYTLPVLRFIRKSAAAVTPSAGPPVVHCSAGVGRTGTYIVIDAMIRQIEDKDCLNIFNFLLKIRTQRPFLVQTEEQYEFIHHVLLEHILAKDTEVKDYALAAYVKSLDEEIPGGDQTLLEQQYKLVMSYEPDPAFDYIGATLEGNKMKNREESLLPVDVCRVALPMKPGVPGSDYINASYLQGYNRDREFIVTQRPLETTVEDFWRMVWHEDSRFMTIVAFEDDSRPAPDFWPTDSKEPWELGHFKLGYIEETRSTSFHFRDFMLSSTQDDFQCQCRLIHTSAGLPTLSTPSSFYELKQTVKDFHHQHEDEGPVVVMDAAGDVMAGLFCALYGLTDQLRKEGCVDIYQLAKLYQSKRPGLFPTKESYRLLYSIMLDCSVSKEYLGSTTEEEGEIYTNLTPYASPHRSVRSTFTHSLSRMSSALSPHKEDVAESNV